MQKVSLDLGSKVDVPPSGPKDARIALVGEAPGKAEVSKEKPFVGTSGRLLNQMLDKVGIKRHRCYVTNLIKRKLPKNKFGALYSGKTPKPELVQARKDLIEEIKEVNPVLTIALGKEAARALLGDNSAAIHDWRGSVVNTEVGKTLFTFHPAYISRIFKENPIMLFDLKKAKKESQTREITRKERQIMTEPNKAEVLAFLKECKKSEYLSFDIETKEIEKGNWFIDCIGLAPRDNFGMSIPLTCGGGESYWSILDEIEILRAIADVLGDSTIKKIAQNAQYDVIFLEKLGIPVNNVWFDTMNASKVLYPEFKKNLAFLVSIYTTEPFYKDTSTKERWIYNGKDSTCTFEVAMGLIKDMKDFGVYDFYRNHVHPLITLYIDVQQFGVRVDEEEFNKVKTQVKKDLKKKRKALEEKIGKKINVNPSNSLKDFLYHDLGAKERRTDKGSLRTDKDTLLKIKKEKNADVIDDILEIREIRDLESSYLKVIRNEDKRMRCTYSVSGTETGRLSSTKTPEQRGMNLQNREKKYRTFFIPDEGFVFMGADLSQAENRVVAYLCKDKRMIDVVERGGDIHTNNAAMIFDKKPENVSSEERDLGKRITHGANYLMGTYTFAKISGQSVTRSKKLLKKYHRTYPKVRLWHKKVEKEIRRTRTLINPFGRKRQFNDRIGDHLFREAVAFVPQSTVADALHRATRKLYCRLPHPNRIVMNLHDALFLQVKDDVGSRDFCKHLMKKYLQEPFIVNNTELSIPTEVVIGQNWKEVS